MWEAPSWNSRGLDPATCVQDEDWTFRLGDMIERLHVTWANYEDLIGQTCLGIDTWGLEGLEGWMAKSGWSCHVEIRGLKHSKAVKMYGKEETLDHCNDLSRVLLLNLAVGDGSCSYWFRWGSHLPISFMDSSWRCPHYWSYWMWAVQASSSFEGHHGSSLSSTQEWTLLDDFPCVHLLGPWGTQFCSALRWWDWPKIGLATRTVRGIPWCYCDQNRWQMVNNNGKYMFT